MKKSGKLAVFAGPVFLLFLSYAIYFVRYPIWGWSVEPIFAALIVSYALILVAALALIKKDAAFSPRATFGLKSWRWLLGAVGLAFLFQALWYSVAAGLGSRFAFSSFPVLRGYELYSYYSLPLAFAFYLAFALFGAFAEEVAYRGYVQTRISAANGVLAGIGFSSLLFALQHIHVFQLSWIEGFFTGQFFNVLIGGAFAGYLFYRTGGNLWAVFLFHGISNVFSVILPIQITYAFPFASWVSTAVSYAVLVWLVSWTGKRSWMASEWKNLDC